MTLFLEQPVSCHLSVHVHSLPLFTSNMTLCLTPYFASQHLSIGFAYQCFCSCNCFDVFLVLTMSKYMECKWNGACILICSRPIFKVVQPGFRAAVPVGRLRIRLENGRIIRNYSSYDVNGCFVTSYNVYELDSTISIQSIRRTCMCVFLLAVAGAKYEFSRASQTYFNVTLLCGLGASSRSTYCASPHSWS